jgi:hypothetical protein
VTPERRVQGVETLDALQFRLHTVREAPPPAAVVDQHVVDEVPDPLAITPTLRQAIRQMRVVATQVSGVDAGWHPPEPQVRGAEQNPIGVDARRAHPARIARQGGVGAGDSEQAHYGFDHRVTSECREQGVDRLAMNGTLQVAAFAALNAIGRRRPRRELVRSTATGGIPQLRGVAALSRPGFRSRESGNRRREPS